MQTSPFRYDIHALRALAVCMVIGYHFQIAGFQNGFIGVDIFLVISGYLISSQALQKLQAGQFSMWQFLHMRLRRIFPALYLVVMVSVLLGWQSSLPSEYLKQLRQAMSALSFVSNIAFSNDSGYFSAAAQTKPLLHTWSLSVEWQFYVVLPIVFLALQRLLAQRLKLRAAAACLGLLAALSFAWCLWQSAQDSSSAFFSLRARAWELLLGGLVACSEALTVAPAPLANRRPNARLGVCLLGWVLLGAGCVAPLSESHWPGPATLLPVLGTALVVASRAQLASPWLGLAAVQRLGDWSYSLYLWHWPLWVYTSTWLSLRGDHITLALKAALVLLTVLLGYFSFTWVEQPLRINRAYWTARRLLGGAAAGWLSLVLVSAVIFALQGVPQRLPAYIQRAELARSVNTPRDECFRDADSQKAAPDRYCTFGPDAPRGSGAASLLLWGDSIANQYLEPLSQAAHTANLAGLIATQSGCRAFVDSPTAQFGVPDSCRQFNRDVLALLRSAQGPGIVVLARNWGAAEEMTVLVSTLLELGKTVVLVLPSLGLGFDVPEKWIEMQYRAGRAIDNWSLPASPLLLQSELRAQIATATAPFQNNPKFIQLDPLPMVCQDGVCYLVRNGQVNFRDTLHISNVNSAMYNHLFNQALAQAAARPR